MANEPNESSESQSAPEVSAARAEATPSINVWARIKEHKIAQWTLAYAAAAYALLDGTKIVSDAFDWPHQVLRIVTVLLILGLPLVVTLAWFHGHRALRRVSGRELTIITVLLVLAGAVLWHFAREPEARVAPTVQPGAASEHVVATVPAKGSIAVLPLANESGDPSQQYFSDGLSENLITALTQFPELKVIGRTSAFQFRDSKEDAHSIGAKLGVARLLEGSVQRSEETVRVSAELIDTADGSTKWSERYDRPYKDLFALQDDITHAVAEALRAKLLPSQQAQAQSDRPPGGSLEAYNALLQGRFYFDQPGENGNRQAIERLSRATQLDARYALAWSELSKAWIGHGAGDLTGKEAQEAYATAREAADRALSLSPGLANAHEARGLVLMVADFDWRGAQAEFRRAMELSPSDGEAKYWYATQLATLGDAAKAVELTQQALATDPLHAYWYQYLADFLTGLNRADEAERAIRRAMQLLPDEPKFYERLTAIEVRRGRGEAALALARQVQNGFYRDMSFALAQQISGNPKAADSALKTLITNHVHDAPYFVAQVYALRNDATATFDWLERARSAREADIIYLLYDPFILRYKDDPRFAAFCRKVGLPVPGEKRTAPNG